MKNSIPSLLFALVGLGTGMVHAATFTVSNTNDDTNAGSLRKAITDALAGGAGPHDIQAGGVTGTISLQSALPTITNTTIRIHGPSSGTLTVTRGVAANFRIFTVTNSGGAASLTINRLTMTNGVGTADVDTTAVGGGIAVSDSTLVLNYCTVSGCSAAGNGGGMFVGGTVASTATVNFCTISGNTSGSAGGGIAASSGTTGAHILNMNNSTISGNQTTAGAGGGLTLVRATGNLTNSTISGNSAFFNGGGVNVSNTASAFNATNCTIANNSTAAGSTGGGGIRAGTSSVVNLINSLVVGNFLTGTGANDTSWAANTSKIAKNSVVGADVSGVGFATATASQVGTFASPKVVNLGVLASNGGVTQTHALLASTPELAINLGSNADASTLPSDQRGIGYNRFNGTIDIGAFENGVTAPSFTGVQPLGAPAQVNNATTLPFTVPPGSNRLLIVSASASDLVNPTDITGVTFNGSAMTLVGKQTDSSVAVDSFWQTTLATGTTAISGTVTVTGTGGTVTEVTAQAFQNVNQALPINKINSGNSTSSGSSSRVISAGNSAVGDLVMDIFDIYDANAVGTQTPGAGQAVVHNVDAPSGSLFGYYMTSLKPGDPAAVSTSYTSSGQAFISIAFNIKQASVATPTVTVPGGTTTLTTTTSGAAGGSVSFSITGANLTGAPGNLTVTAPTNVEVSADNVTFGGTASIPYSTATLASTLVYARLAGTGSVGTISGNVSISGGGLGAAVTQAVSGTLNPAPIAITSLSRVNATPTNAATVNWTLTFASAVVGVTTSNFSLTGPAATGSSVTTATSSDGGITWSVAATTGSTDGLLTLNLANSTGISPVISNTLPFAGQSYTMDKTPPTVVSVNRQAPTNQTTNLLSVTFRVTYSEPVTGITTARYQVVPVNGSNIVGTVTGVTSVGGNPAIYDVTVTLTSGTGEFKLRVID